MDEPTQAAPPRRQVDVPTPPPPPAPTESFRGVGTGPIATPPGPSPPPLLLGDYELYEELGRGGMGIVYRARQRSAGRIVALKVIRPERLTGLAPQDSGQAIERFHLESRAAAQLDHDNIVTIFEVGQANGHHFYSMRYVAGRSLSDLLRDGPLTNRRAASYIEAVARALHEAHRHGILHRDLKPSNILIDERQDRALVADFGLAKLSEGGRDMTMAGEVFGSPPYMSPEQARNAAGVTAVSDVYSLGATLYQLLTGRPPFQAATSLETLRQVIDEEPVPPRRLNRSVDRDLETICLKCLRKDPRGRYNTAADLAADLSRYLHGRPVKARPLGPLAHAWRWSRRHPATSAAVSLAAVATVALAIYWQTRPAYLDLRVSPQGARVTLAGQPIQLENGQALVPWQPGRFEVSATSPGYESRTETVVLSRGRDQAARLNLELQSTYGYLQVDSSPTGARVQLVDARGPVAAEGVTPFHSARVPAGTYRLRVTMDAFRPQEVSVTVPSGERLASVPKVSLDPIGEGVKSHQRVRDIKARLAEPIARPWTFSDTPLKDALKTIESEQKIPISIDNRSLSEAGLSDEQPVTYSQARGTFGQALGLMLAQHELVALPVGELDQLTLQVTTAATAGAKLENAMYFVGDLVTRQGFQGADFDSLIDAITTNIAPVSWDFVGGMGRIAALSEQQTLSVTQTWEAHAAIDAYLEEMRASRAAKSVRARRAEQASESQPAGAPSTMPNAKTEPSVADELDAPTALDRLRQFRKLLDQPLSKPWSAVDEPLNEALASLSLGNKFDMVFVIDQKALVEAGISPENPVSAALPKGSLGTALRTILDPLEMTIVPLGDGDQMVLRVTTQRSAEGDERNLGIVLYPAEGLVDAGRAGHSQFEDLSSKISKSIAPSTWSEAGGYGSLHVSGDPPVLSIRQSWDVLLQVDDLIRQSRAARRASAPSPVVSQPAPTSSPSKDSKVVFVSPTGQVMAPPGAPPAARATPRPLPPRVEQAPAARRQAWDQLADEFRDVASRGQPVKSDMQVATRLREFQRQHGGTAEGLQALALQSQIEWPADRLRREQIPAEALSLAGQGDPARSPPELVAVFGDGKLMHWGPATAVAWHPDGQMLASTGADRAVRLWDPASGRLMRVLAGHSDELTSVAFHREGRWLASASADKTVVIWDSKSGEQLRVFREHIGPVRAVAFRPKSTEAASAGSDLTVRLWDAETGKSRRTLTGHTDQIRALAFHPDGKLMATASADRTIKLWDVEAEGNAPLSSWSFPNEDLRAIQFSPSGDALALGRSGNSPITLIDVASRQLKDSPPHRYYSMSATGLSFSPDGKILARAAIGSPVTLWNVASMSDGSGARMASDPQSPNCVAFSPDGQSLALAYPDGAVRIRPREPKPGQEAPAYVMLQRAVLSGDGATLATCDLSGNVRVWSVADQKNAATHRTYVNSMFGAAVQFPLDIAFSADDQALFIPGATWTGNMPQGVVTRWDWRSNKKPTEFPIGAAQLARKLAASADGRFLAVGRHPMNSGGSAGHGTAIIDPQTGVFYGELAENGFPLGVAIAPDATKLAIISGMSIGLWTLADPPAQQTIARTESLATSLAFSPDGGRIAAGSFQDGSVRLWDAGTQQSLHTEFVPGQCTSVGFSPDGKTLISTHSDGRVRLWNGLTGEARETLVVSPEGGQIWHATYTPEGRHIITANGNGTAYVLRLGPPVGKAVP